MAEIVKYVQPRALHCDAVTAWRLDSKLEVVRFVRVAGSLPLRSNSISIVI
jgi:hypothetical protein